MRIGTLLFCSPLFIQDLHSVQQQLLVGTRKYLPRSGYPRVKLRGIIWDRDFNVGVIGLLMVSGAMKLTLQNVPEMCVKYLSS